ncbi:glyoxylase-like metal-dependent hydrolase (beta-lactamase superfamily II) [Actinomadura luteofluorescens]|uniref:Glyoxylase-like metal-dependent hydrolase (Beta-lactamase superfamily II) n=1 Tax=Actinomadura luteofluorescens TaxID=46163 RepID=A0A7Y9EI25_9ACTN|nr:MBL fold metallo-hydrolase [Actinomadura luteofluorescens]NYD48088.1 glyoxylase-like metal-dependent hydrolase (beta-lactamase superfamily II) [Actinomadura luteofluorescens]
MRLTQHVELVGSGAAGFDLTDPLDCHVYLVRGSRGSALVDAGAGVSAGLLARRMLAAAGPAGERHLLLTHGHADHAGGAAGLARGVQGLDVRAGAPASDWIASGEEEKLSVDRGKAAGVYPEGYTFPACPAVRPIADGERVDLGGGVALQAVATPGHADGHTCYLLDAPEGRALFSGDCVFTGGRISLQNLHDSRVPDYAASLERLAGLEVDMLLPGHHEISLARAGRHLRAARDVLRRGLLPGSTT